MFHDLDLIGIDFHLEGLRLDLCGGRNLSVVCHDGCLNSDTLLGYVWGNCQEEWIIYVRLPVELTILAMAFAFVIGRHIDDVVPRLGSLSLGCLCLNLPMDAGSENSWLMAGE